MKTIKILALAISLSAVLGISMNSAFAQCEHCKDAKGKLSREELVKVYEAKTAAHQKAVECLKAGTDATKCDEELEAAIKKACPGKCPMHKKGEHGKGHHDHHDGHDDGAAKKKE